MNDQHPTAEEPTAAGDERTGPAPDTETTPDGETAPEGKRGGHITKIVFALTALLFVWYVAADRFTPYTDQARIDGFVIPIVPQVSGYVTEVGVRLHDVVETGDLIVQLDRRPFELALASAEAQLDVALQNVGAQSAGVQAAAAQLGVSRASLDRAQRNYDRVQEINSQNPGALSQADRDGAETSLDQAQERVTAAEADLERARVTLGPEGLDNPQVRAAIAAVERAQLDLEFSTVTAPAPAGVENFRIDLGYYAPAGQPLGTLVSGTDAWIQADLRENNLAHIEPGDRVEFALDVAPGRVFSGTVRTVGFGIGQGQEGSAGSLETVTETKGWLRDPQLFPVVISIDETSGLEVLRAGGQANVIVYTGGHPILSAIARFRIRLVSWLSFVR